MSTRTDAAESATSEPGVPVISTTTITFTVLHRTDEPVTDHEEILERSRDGRAVG